MAGRVFGLAAWVSGRASVWLVCSAVGAGAVMAAEPPLDFDLASGRGVRWTVELGSYAYGGPVVAGGRIFVGTNNSRPRDPGLTGDRGVLVALDASDGTVLWQAVHEKLAQALDYPLQGVCSTPAVVGDRLYYVSNRGELICLDVEGFADGENDGPVQDEERRGARDADVVWRLDLPARLGVVPHFMSATTPAVEGDLVFAVTSNGIDEAGGVPAPQAPSFVAVDRRDGTVRWSDASPGSDLVDGQWGSARVATLAGRRQVLFPGGDGRLYAFVPESGELLWRHDGNAFPGEPLTGRARNALVASPVVAEGRVLVALGRDPEEGSGRGSVWAIHPPRRGAGYPGVDWFFGDEQFGRAIADVAVANGIVYAADLNGFVVAIDLATGERFWRHDVLAPVWATPAVIEDRLWIADTDGDIEVLATGRTLEVVAALRAGAPVYRAPVWSDGSLYLLAGGRLVALAGD